MDAARLNRMLENRVRDLASRKPARTRSEHEERAKTSRDELLKSLGLYPLPPRTDLQPVVTGTIVRDGYRIEKIAFYSRPGVRTTAHLYLPDLAGRVPVVLCPHGHWPNKKSEPVVQAQGIGLALQGIAALVVDSPGYSWDDNDRNERRSLGPHDDPILAMGLPVQGVYVWDLIRGIDYLQSRSEIDDKKIGIAGASGGGTATVLAFAIDERLSCAAPICYATSLETNPHNGCLCNHLPGIATLGDRSDWLAIRAPLPVILVGAKEDPEFPPEGHQKTYEKLQAIYNLFGSAHKLHLELFEGPHDMNRRMREATLAFFGEHLQGKEPRSYREEKRPLTDGAANSYPANTELPESHEMLVLSPEERSGTTFRDLLLKGLHEPYPEQFDANARMVPWGKYGRLPELDSRPVLVLADKEREGALVLPYEEIDQRLCFYSGLSVPEFLAQMLHRVLPGGSENWEDVAVVGDVVTSMIASMKTLVGAKESAEQPLEVAAEGPLSSMTAIHLKALRPDLELSCSHPFKNWLDVFNQDFSVLSMPRSRYLSWPI